MTAINLVMVKVIIDTASLIGSIRGNIGAEAKGRLDSLVRFGLGMNENRLKYVQRLI